LLKGKNGKGIFFTPIWFMVELNQYALNASGIEIA